MAYLIGQTKIPAADNLLAGSAPDPFPTLGGSWGDCHGIVHPAVRRSAGLRLPLLRSHRHIRSPERLVATRAGGALLPQRGRCRYGQQGGPQPAHRRLPGLGGSLCPQSSAADRVGREGSAQGRSRSAVATPHGAARRLRRLLYPQEHGAGCELSRQRAEIPKYASKDPNYRILARQRSRFTHYYFYIRDEVLGPIVMRVGS